MLEEIDELKKYLNDMMDNEDVNPEDILKISQKLDMLIVEYYKTMGLNK